MEIWFTFADRCKSFDDTDTQLKFVELQLFLLRYFINKLEDIGDIEASSSNYKYLFALLNGSQYINDLLHEWSEHVVSIFNQRFFSYDGYDLS